MMWVRKCMTVFARISDAVERFRRRHHSTSEIRIENDGFCIFHAKMPEDRVKFDEVSEVTGYKVDQIAVDLICCDIVTGSGGAEMIRTIDEEMTGFHLAMTCLENLPGFYVRWREAVILPPFDVNYTLLYRRGIDLSLAAEPVRLELPTREPWPLKQKIRILAILVALLVVVILFHKAKDFLAVDHCLDAGGAWNEQGKRCEGARY